MKYYCNWIHVYLGSRNKPAAPNTEKTAEELGRVFESIITGINKLDPNGMGHKEVKWLEIQEVLCLIGIAQN